MISLILRSFLWFTASFVVLSIPVSQQPIFDHITNIFGPTTQGFIQDFSKRANESVQVGKKAVDKLFETVPKNTDKLKLQQSSIDKEELPEEEYTIEEKQMLQQILTQ